MTDPMPNAPSLEKASLFEDLIDIWYAPSKVFARRAEGGAWGPFLVVSLVLIVLYFASAGMMQGVLDAEMARAVAEAQRSNPNLSADQIAGMQKMMSVTMRYGAMAGMPIALLLLGAVTWLVGRILGGSLGFGTGVMIASLAYVPKALELLMVAVQGLLLDASTWTSRFQFSWGVGRFMDHGGKQGLIGFVGRLDVFTLWVTILIAIGLVHAGKVDKSKMWIAAALVWLIGGIGPLFQLVTGK